MVAPTERIQEVPTSTAMGLCVVSTSWDPGYAQCCRTQRESNTFERATCALCRGEIR